MFRFKQACNNVVLLTAMLCISIVSTTGCAPVWLAGTVAGASATIATDRRDPSTILNDTGMEIRLTDKIYGDKQLGKSVRVNVTVFNQLVLLTGEAPNARMRDKLTELASTLEGAREIYNEVTISEPIPLNNRTHDSWISSKIKTRLIVNRGLFTRTRVITSNGTVYLMGLATREESNQATRIVSEVQGIQGIVSLFEPISEEQKREYNRNPQKLAEQTPQDIETRQLADEEADLAIIRDTGIDSATVSNE